MSNERLPERHQQSPSDSRHRDTMQLATSSGPCSCSALVCGTPPSWTPNDLEDALRSLLKTEMVDIVRFEDCPGRGFLVRVWDETDLASLLALDDCAVRDAKLRIKPWVAVRDDSSSSGDLVRSPQSVMKHSRTQLEVEMPSKRTRLSSNYDVRSSPLTPSIDKLRMRNEYHVELSTIPRDVSLEDLEAFINGAMRNKEVPGDSDPVVASIPLNRYACRFICISPVAAQNIVKHLRGIILNDTILEFQLVKKVTRPAELTLADRPGTDKGCRTYPEDSFTPGQCSRISRLVYWKNPPKGLSKIEAMCSLNDMVIGLGMSDDNVIVQVVARKVGFIFTAKSKQAAEKVVDLSGRKFRGTTLRLERDFNYMKDVTIVVAFSSFSPRSEHSCPTTEHLMTFMSNEMKKISGFQCGEPLVSCKQKSPALWNLTMASPEHAEKCSTLDGVLFQEGRLWVKRHRSRTGCKQFCDNIENDFEDCKPPSGVSMKIHGPRDKTGSDDLIVGRGMTIEDNPAGRSRVEAWTRQECVNKSHLSSDIPRATNLTSKEEPVADIESQMVSDGNMSTNDTVALKNDHAKLKEENERLRRNLTLVVKKDQKMDKERQELDFETNHLQRELALVTKERDYGIRQSQLDQEEKFRAQHQLDSNLEEIKHLKDDLEILKQQCSSEVSQNKKQQADNLKLRCQYDTEVAEKTNIQRLYEAAVEENKNLLADLTSTKEKLHVIHGDWQALKVTLEETNLKHESERRQLGHELDQLRQVLNETMQAKDELLNLYNAAQSSKTTLSKNLVTTKDEVHHDF